MASHKELVRLDGLLRGEGREASCTVLATRVTLPGAPVPPAHTKFRIETVEADLPEGNFELLVAGESIRVRYKNGQWLAAA